MRSSLHALAGHDAFAGRAGLGKGVVRTLAAIVAEPGVSVAQLGARPALPTVRTLDRHVRVLGDAGLVDADGAGWRAVPDDLLVARLDALAVELGTGGTGRARVVLHDRQRRGYAEHRARLARQRRDMSRWPS